MPITMHEIMTSFRGSLVLNHKILKEFYNASSLELWPELSSPLFLECDRHQPISLFLPFDEAIGLRTLLNKDYDPHKQTFFVTTQECAFNRPVNIYSCR
jgi:hypothetical protein